MWRSACAELGPDRVRARHETRATFHPQSRDGRSEPKPSEQLLALKGVVGTAPQREIRHVRRSAVRERDHVMEFEPSGLAAAPLWAFKGTAAAIASPDFAPDCRGDVPPVRSAWSDCRPYSPSLRELLALELIDEHGQRPIEDGGVIARRNRVPQQILRLPKLTLGPCADGHPEQIAVFGKRGDSGRWRRGRANRIRRRSLGRCLVRCRPRPRIFCQDGRGQSANDRPRIRLGREARDLLFDLELGLVPGGLQQTRVVLISEMRLEQLKRRQRQRALLEQCEYDWELPGRASRRDPVIGRMLREMEHLGAVGEDR